jgi:DNA-binding NtrC family response regulator
MNHIISTLREKQALAKLVGSASTFVEAIRNLPLIAQSDATVLITGETGTGKELVARAIHYLSERAAHPFVPLNCGSFPDPLMEVELFGHERGAFTDAHTRRKGLLAQTEGGTLFLDEVDTLPAKAQVDLLRFLQDKSYRMVGSGEEFHANVRVLAASNAALLQLAQSGAFRADLYYRLCVFTIHLPALQERSQDIPILAEHFLSKHAPLGGPIPRLSNEALADLMLREWPGNVRELENAVVRGIHLSRGDIILPRDLSLPVCGSRSLPGVPQDCATLPQFRTLKRQVIESFERNYLTLLMAEHHGNVSIAARAAGKERRDLGRMLKKYQLDARSFQFPRPPIG